MKLVDEYAVTKKSSNYESKQFGVADMSLIVELLTKLYANPKQTLTQEYICNARDANREVGQTRPIEITAPSRLNPVMSIRDFGPGLSPERINETFLFYGASTKNDDNLQTGGFGIGAKSAWAYTEVFTINSFCNGVKRSYVAHKSKGNGNLDLIFEKTTDEIDGTEIQVAVNMSDVNAFKNAILRAVGFWKESEKPVLKGFDVEATFFPETFKLENLEILDNGVPSFLNCYGRVHICVDGILYEISNGRLYNAISGILSLVKSNIVLHVNVGDLKIAPTRENIIDNDDNIAVIRKLSDYYVIIVKKYISSELEKNKDTKDKLVEYVKLYKIFAMDSLCGGYKINGSYILLERQSGCSKKPLIEYSIRNSKMRGREECLLNINYIENIYYDDIGKSETLIKKRFRISSIVDFSNSVYVISKPDVDVNIHDALKLKELEKAANNSFEKLKSDLGAKPLSSISLDGYVKPVRVKNGPVVKKDFCFHFYNGFRLDAQQINEDHAETVVFDYIDTENPKSNYSNRKDLHELITYLSSKNIKFGFVCKAKQKIATRSKNLTHLDVWLKSHMPSEIDIEYTLMLDVVKFYGALNYLTIMGGKIEDPLLDSILELSFVDCKKCVDSKKVPRTIFKDKIEDSIFYKQNKFHIDNAQANCDDIRSKYLLLGEINSSRVKYSSDIRQHVLNYLNSTYRESKIGSI